MYSVKVTKTTEQWMWVIRIFLDGGKVPHRVV